MATIFLMTNAVGLISNQLTKEWQDKQKATMVPLRYEALINLGKDCDGFSTYEKKVTVVDINGNVQYVDNFIVTTEHSVKEALKSGDFDGDIPALKHWFYYQDNPDEEDRRKDWLENYAAEEMGYNPVEVDELPY